MVSRRRDDGGRCTSWELAISQGDSFGRVGESGAGGAFHHFLSVMYA